MALYYARPDQRGAAEIPATMNEITMKRSAPTTKIMALLTNRKNCKNFSTSIHKETQSVVLRIFIIELNPSRKLG